VTGLRIRTDRWNRVPLGRLLASVVPRHDGIGIAASIAS